MSHIKLNPSRHFFLLIGLIGSLVVTGCSSVNPEPTPDSEPSPLTSFSPVVSATGEVVPLQSATLSMNQGGILAAVMVAEGDMIEAGQLIARREQQLSRETLEAGLAASQFELASAQQALTDLYDAVPLQAVQAQIDLANAQDQLNDAEYRWRVQQPGNRASGDIINASEANLILANNQVDKAQKEFNKYSGRADDDPARALALSNLSAARQQRDAILRQLNWYTGQPNNIDQAILDAEVAVAQVQLEEAQVNYDMLQAGPDPELTALAQERIDNALAQVAAAEAALNDLDPDLELLAPFDGTVVELFVNEAEWVSPGQPILVLADLNQLRVETTDLSEIDVAQIAVGDTAAVTFDALANVVTNATIVRISDRAATGSGVNYRVILELDELPPGLRWGMTAFVDIEIELLSRSGNLMNTDSKWLIETQNLTRIYGDGEEIRALDGVDLKITRGELVTIMGPSGSGKSTLLNMIGALDVPTDGKVFVNGQDLAKIRNKDTFRAKSVGFVFQLHNLLPTLTARENVEVPMIGYANRRTRRKRAEELLSLVDLADRMKHLPNQLSGGQRQRVAVARALANNPPLILADEPTGSLDTQAGRDLMNLLRELNENYGTTFMVVTHDPAVARQTNRVVVMADGKIVREDIIGSPVEEDLKMWRHSGLGRRIVQGEIDTLDNVSVSPHLLEALQQFFQLAENE